MVNKILLTLLGMELAFLASGALILAASVIFKPGLSSTHILADPASTVLMQSTPLTALLVNAILIFASFLLALPDMASATNTRFLRAHAILTLLCASVTLIIGLDIWISTLKTKTNLAVIWAALSPSQQSLLQQQFTCCGYASSTSPPFAPDATCPSASLAAALGGCLVPFSTYANQFLDIIFTALFGIVGLDAALFLTVLVTLKDRAERARYHAIDQKCGVGGI